MTETQQMARDIEQIFELCKRIDTKKLQWFVDQAERQETTGVFFMSPIHYKQATEQNREATKRTKALMRLVELVQKEN